MYQDEQRRWHWINGAAIAYRNFHRNQPDGNGKTIHICRDVANKDWGGIVGGDDENENGSSWALCEWGY